MTVDPWADLERVSAATDRLAGTLEGMDRADAAAPSLLPGWSRAHVVSHLTRNADALVHLVLWAKTGERMPMYDSARQRAEDIEKGVAVAPEQALVDLRGAAERFRGGVVTFEDADLDTVVPSGFGGEGREVPARLLPWLRLQEVEIHHVDLDLGYGPADWPGEFTTRLLGEVLGGLAGRGDAPHVVVRSTETGSAWALRGGGPEVSGTSAGLLAWLIGRSDGAGLAVAGGGDLPAPPAWR